MTFALQLFLTGCALWLAALIVCTCVERYQQRKRDAEWVDALIARHRAELRRRYKNGQFKPKSLWTNYP